MIYEALYDHCDLTEDAYAYLTGCTRKLKDETIRQFKLFSIDNTHKTIKYLTDNFLIDELKIAGLFNDNGYFLFTHHTLIIPYIEGKRIIYLRGRSIKESLQTTSKYIGLMNFAQKLSSKRFYNADALKSRHSKILVITEGEFDCMIAVQNNLDAIGVPGVTNFPKNQINLLDKYDIYLCFDNDPAGRRITKEVADLLDRPVKVIRLKGHKDLSEVLG